MANGFRDRSEWTDQTFLRVAAWLEGGNPLSFTAVGYDMVRVHFPALGEDSPQPFLLHVNQLTWLLKNL